MRLGQNLNRNLASRLTYLLRLWSRKASLSATIAGFLVVIVLVGCIPPAPLPISGGLLPGDNTTSEICITIAQLDAMKAEAYQAGQLAGCKADIVLMNPTYAQLQKFLKDNRALTMCEGNCIDRTIDLSECAIHNGWEMYVVLLNFKETGTGHVIGAFQTRDKGMVFIEPQTLWEVRVEKGYDYSLNFTQHNWSFPKSTIKQIGIIR